MARPRENNSNSDARMKNKSTYKYTQEYEFDGMERLIECQNMIEWQAFWDGCLSHELRAIQQSYLT